MPNWGLIGSGAAFQSLANTLLLFEDATNRVFGRPGRDGGLDARSLNGQTIWQAKFHQNPGIDKTIGDARTESGKIANYRTPTDSRFLLWQHAQKWILVTNLRLNPNDHARWDTEIVPVFQALGLTAEIWGEEKLEALLVAHPHVERSFFGGTNRCFLSLGEAYEYLDQEGPRQHGLELPVVGRNADLQTLEQFLQGTKKIICIHGVGGVGKSRLLLEVGSRLSEQGSHQILWANVETMAQSTDWFTFVAPEQPTLLLLDEPTDERMIALIAEQLRSATARTNQWKVIVAMRSPKDPILKAYRRLPPAIKEDFLPLSPPANDDACLIGRALIDQGPLAVHPEDEKERAVRHIIRICGRIPVWITLAIKVLETTNSLQSLPSNAAEIAHTYLDEVIDHQPQAIASKAQITALIRWLAIYRGINTQDEPLMEFLVKITRFATKTELLRALISLVERRFVVNRGIQNRLFEIKPDVMNDFVLSQWLATDSLGSTQGSPEAEELVRMIMGGFDGKPIPSIGTVLHSLAGMEIRAKMQDEDLRLLDPLVAALKEEVLTEPVNTLPGVVQLLDSISFARVADTVDIIRIIRLNPRPSVQVDTIFGARTLTHDDVVKTLSWALFVAGQYAQSEVEREAVLQEMSALFLAEFGMEGLPQNDGKRSRDLIPRLIAGGPGFLSTYEPEGFAIALRRLHEIQGMTQPVKAQLQLCKSFVKYFMTVDRSHTRFSDHQFTVSSWVIPLNGPEGARRTQLTVILREMTSSANQAIADFAWNLLAEAHSSASRALSKIPAQYRPNIQDDLVWVKGRIEAPGTRLATMKKARNLWNWHAQYDEDPELRNLALECEAIYRANPLVLEFDVFFNFERYSEVEQASLELGRRLAALSSDEIFAFIARAEEFASEDANWGDIIRTTSQLAEVWETNSGIPRFARSALRLGSDSRARQYAIVVLERRLGILRQGGRLEELAATLAQHFALCPDATSQLDLLLAIYFRVHPHISGILTQIDFEFFAGHLGLFPPERRWQLFRCLGALFYTDWPNWRVLVQRLWQETPQDKLGQCFNQLVDAMFFMPSFRNPQLVRFTQDQFDWIMTLLIDLPDFEEVQTHQSWQLEQLRDSFPRKSIGWLNDALEARLQRSSTDSNFKVVGMHFELSHFVERVTSASATDPDLQREVERLLRFNAPTGSLAYHLPAYARNVDPEGFIVPGAVIAQMQAVAPQGARQLGRWVQFAEYYPKNSAPWRQIASEAVNLAQGYSTEDRSHIYFHLEDRSRSSNHPAGEMDPQPGLELERCRQEFDAELDPLLREYRQWEVDRARALYEHTVARFEEEQGNSE